MYDFYKIMNFLINYKTEVRLYFLKSLYSPSAQQCSRYSPENRTAHQRAPLPSTSSAQIKAPPSSKSLAGQSKSHC